MAGSTPLSNEQLMARPEGNRKQKRGGTANRASWMALVAATTLGSSQVAAVRARVSADEGPEPTASDPSGYRLIVQSYAPGTLTSDQLPGEYARPLGSTQRAVTQEELRRGVSVDVLELGDDGELPRAAVVVAWVEAGQPDLEYDGLRARPAPGAVYGTSRPRDRSRAGLVRVVLRRRSAA